MLSIENPQNFIGQIFNVGLSSANISKLELCEKIKEIVPKFTYLESELGKDPDQRNYIVSNEKIEKVGFSPIMQLDDGLQELVKMLPMYNQKLFGNV